MYTKAISLLIRHAFSQVTLHAYLLKADLSQVGYVCLLLEM